MQSGRPIEVLRNSVNREVRVVLKNEAEYVGRLIEVDAYMNLVLERVEEYVNGNRRASYPHLLIRGNNVVYVAVVDSL
ncbi:MAG: LSM domain-containing protein [Candidatus Caldarchaeales archaeon]